jgi:nicotinamidase-related amidase
MISVMMLTDGKVSHEKIYLKGRRQMVNDWEIRGKPALIILHMQELIAVGRADPSLLDAMKKAGTIPHQQTLLKAFRDKKLPVIYVNVLVTSNKQNPAGSFPAYGNLFRRMEAREAYPNDMEVIPELSPQPGEPVLSNWFIGAFSNSGLDQVLKARGVETLVLTGVATHVVVYTTALQAIELMYSVILVSDACTSRPEQAKAHETVLEIMGPTIALVTSTEDVITHL